jgi:hypothetical protein
MGQSSSNPKSPSIKEPQGLPPVLGVKKPMGDVPWSPPPTCKQDEYRLPNQYFDVEFSDQRALSVLQTVSRGSEPRIGAIPSVSGDVIVRRRQSDGPKAGIELEIITNDESIDVEVNWDSELQQLEVLTPQKLENWVEKPRPCIQIRITIWAPEDAVLRVLGIGAVHLNIKLIDNMVINVLVGTELNSIVGNVIAAADLPARDSADIADIPGTPQNYVLNSRAISVRSTSGDIKGWWPLYDVLDVNTQSGDIKISVGPKPVEESDPKSAVLTVQSASGTVSVWEPIHDALNSTKPEEIIPPRDYMTHIESISGGISTWVAFSSIGKFSAVSGDLAIDLLPIYDVSFIESLKGSGLTTETKSGNVALRLFEPYWMNIVKPNGILSGTINPAIANLPLPEDSTDRHPKPVISVVGNTEIQTIKLGERDEEPVIPFLPISPGGFPGGPMAPVSPGAPVPRVQPTAGHPTLKCLHADHQTLSGDMKLKYPASWQGLAYASTISGDIRIHGEGVSVTKRSGYPRAVTGRKGSEGSQTKMSTMTGNQDLLIGED